MKKLFILSALMLFVGFAVSAQRGQVSLGSHLAYNTEEEMTGLGVRFQYNLLDRLRMSPQFTYFIENNHKSALSFDFDLHYSFPVSDNLTFYPIGGFNFTDVDFANYSDSGFGFNSGIGMQFSIIECLDFTAEYKRSILIDLSDMSTMAFSVVYKF